ncbi:MAG TPA: archease [Candidatus Binatia bacterium]|nr:archease [Candidatus Binatia bacterium]
MGRYEVLETIAVADCALEIHGEDLDDLFATAGRALAETMVDPATLVPTVERTLRLEAPSLDLLLFDWLSELIYLKDSERLVFPRVEARVEADGPCRLAARLAGGRLDPPRTALRADVKAVTFHRFSVERHGRGWLARVVLDI